MGSSVPSGAPQEGLWGVWVASWGEFEASWGGLGAVLGPLRAVSWGYVGTP